jgi:hypothetical protein
MLRDRNRGSKQAELAERRAFLHQLKISPRLLVSVYRSAQDKSQSRRLWDVW